MPFPFFLAYAAAVLEREGFNVLLIDGIAEKMKEDNFINRLNKFAPDLILLEVSTPSIETDMKIVKRVRDAVGKRTKIALAGLHALMFNEKFLAENMFVDFVFVGEYEYTLRDLAKSLFDGSPLSEVKGLIWRDETGKSRMNQRRPVIENLDELPWPARHFLPMRNYHDEPGKIPRPALQLWSSRGCPFNCTFCVWPQVMYANRKYRTRDPNDVVAEIEWAKNEYGFKSFYIDDDTFNIGKKRILKFCDELKRRKIDLPWAIMARADTSDEETLKVMRNSGLHALKYGIESGVQKLVDNCNKELNLKKAAEMIEVTKRLGIKMHLTFAFGLPGETEETARKTIEFCLNLDPDSVQFSIITPFPGSKSYEELDKEGFIENKDWEEYDGYNRAVIRTESLLSDELLKLQREACDRWKKHLHQRGDTKIKLKDFTKLENLKKGIRHPLKAFKRIIFNP